MIIVGISTLPTMPLPKLLVNKTQEVLEYIDANLARIVATESQVVFDMDKDGIVLSSHSAGGKILTELLEQECRNFKALVMFDPVDGEVTLSFPSPFDPLLLENLSYL